jgi:hypothetical protein
VLHEQSVRRSSLLKYLSRLHFAQKRELCCSAISSTGCGRTTIRPTRRHAEGAASSITILRRSPNREITVEIFCCISVHRTVGHLERKPLQLATKHSLTFNFHVFSKSTLSPCGSTSTLEAHPVNLKTLRHPKSKTAISPCSDLRPTMTDKDFTSQ